MGEYEFIIHLHFGQVILITTLLSAASNGLDTSLHLTIEGLLHLHCEVGGGQQRLQV